MCYHTTYLFLTCGHAALSSNPISHCAQQGAQTIPRHSEREEAPTNAEILLPSPPATPTPPTDCRQKLTHPLHTFRIKSLCPNCQEERDARIEAFEAQMREDLEQRIQTRSAERNERGSEFGRRRLFRASTSLAMTMDAPGLLRGVQTEEAWDGHSQAETLRSPVGESVGKIVDGFRWRVGWNNTDAASMLEESRLGSGEQPAAPPCSPLTARLSFAALADRR